MGIPDSLGSNPLRQTSHILQSWAPPPMNPLPERIGPYKISPEIIGKGGFGQVFEGFHESLQRRAAVKVLLPEKLADRDTVARFVREARALATFKGHRGIVQVQHFEPPGEEPPYLAMDLLEGKTLRQWLIEQNGPLALNLALTLGQQIAAIMVDVHAKELVHRDLKPENIMLVSDDQSPLHLRPILLDFGIAKVTLDAPFDDQSLTQVKTTAANILGSVPYMSPEQIIDADKVTPKADVYTLGIIFYELLTGKPPFVSDNSVKRVQMHVKDQPTPLRTMVPTISPILSSFVASMLAKKPHERPSMRDCQAMFARDFSVDDQACPFPGLQPFNDSLQHLFFGRNEEKHLVLRKLDEIREDSTRRWLQVQGPSGAGKSSFVHAAILPALDSTQWAIIKMRPGDDPIRSLAEALALAYEQNASEIIGSFRNDPKAFDGFLKEHTGITTKILLVIDQFEELFALGSAHIKTFAQLLTCTLQNPDSPLRLLTTIRSDYLHRFDLTLDLAKLLDTFAVRYDLRPMDEKALAEVIETMASRAGLRLTDGLTKRMVQDASGNDYRLPLVGHALRSLWALRETGEITHADYEKMGGVGGALAKQAKELLESKAMGAGGREAAKWMLLDLVHVGQGAPDTRRPRMRSEIDLAVGKSEDALCAWKCLSGEEANLENGEPFRLLVISGDAADPEKQRVELVHEMVLHKVPLVVEWINAERDFLELLSALESAAQAWFQLPKKDGLPSGTLLEHYRGGKDEARRTRVLRMASVRAQEFLNEALRAEKRKKRIQIGVGAALVLAVLMIVASAGMAVQARNRAEENLDAMLATTDEAVNDVDWPMGRIGHTASLRKKMLTSLSKSLVKLEQQDPDGIRERLVDTTHRLSDFERSHGTVAAAHDYVMTAELQITQGLAKFSNDNDLKGMWALHLSKRGKVHLLKGECTEALQDFNESVDKLGSLVGKSDYADEQTLATSIIEKGDAFRCLDQLKDAHTAYTAGLKIRQRLTENLGGKDLDYKRALLAEAFVLRARVDPEVESAKADLKSALKIVESLLVQQDHNLLFQSIRTSAYVSIANHDGNAEAWRKAEFAAALLQKSAPEQKEYALLLIDALRGLEKARGETGDIGGKDEARAARCKIIREFASRDREDKRFDAGECK